MRTIGRNWPKSAPPNDYQCMCSICGVHWRRSQMRRDAAGRLLCPDDSPGRDEVTLDRLNASHASRKRAQRRMDDGSYDTEAGAGGDVPQRTTAADIEL